MALVRGNVRDFTPNVPNRITSGSVKFILVAPPQTSHVPVSKSTGNRAPVVYDVDVNEDGSFKAFVLSNDQIRPVGTVYHVALLVPNVSIVPGHYIFDGDGIIDLALTKQTSVDEQRRAHEASLPTPVIPVKVRERSLLQTGVENVWDWRGTLSFMLHAYYDDGFHETLGPYTHFNLLDAARQGLISKFRPGPGKWRETVR